MVRKKHHDNKNEKRRGRVFGVHVTTKDGTLKRLFFSLFYVATSALDTGDVSRFVLFQNAFHPPLHVPVVHPR